MNVMTGMNGKGTRPLGDWGKGAKAISDVVMGVERWMG